MNYFDTRRFGRPSDADMTDEAKMDQIRELLHGELKRQHESRIAALEQRVRDLESGVSVQLDALRTRLDALTGQLESERRTQFDELARSILDMGERVRRLGRD
jgi:hypothetical protein